MSNPGTSLSRKLCIRIMWLAVPAFILALGLFFLQSRYLIRKEAIDRSNSILQAAIQRVSNYTRTIEVSVNANAWLLEESFRPDSLQAISQRIVRLNPHIISCSVSAAPDVFPQYGKYFSVYTVKEGDAVTSVIDTEYEYADKSWYKTPSLKGEACWIEPFDEYVEGAVDPNKAVATYCRPLRSQQGDVLGIVAADLSFSRMAKATVATEQPYPGAYFVLLGADGRFFIHPDSTRLFRKTIFTDADPNEDAELITLGYQMIGGKEGTMHVTVNGSLCHVSYQPVPGTDWSLALISPESEVLEGYHRLAYVIVVLIFLGLMLMAWMNHRVVRRNIKPIRELLSYTKLIAEGRYDGVILQSDRHDDIAQLQNSFAAMQVALNDRMGSISQAAEEIRKRNEQRARDMQLAEEAVQKQTLFIENLSHQIRTPLNIIIGFANILRENIDIRSKDAAAAQTFVNDKLADVTDMMKYNAIHLKRMVLMLFDSSSVNGAEQLMNDRRDEVSCNQVARESIDYTTGHFQGVKIKLETELSDDIRILTNHLYLMRSIRELLYNAAKYSDGKNVTMKITDTEEAVRFIVEDTGTGMAEEYRALIFEPFTKVNDLSEGLGLGLPLAKRHAENLGGDLWLDESYDKGCRFILELPKYR